MFNGKAEMPASLFSQKVVTILERIKRNHKAGQGDAFGEEGRGSRPNSDAD